MEEKSGAAAGSSWGKLPLPSAARDSDALPLSLLANPGDQRDGKKLPIGSW